MEALVDLLARLANECREAAFLLTDATRMFVEANETSSAAFQQLEQQVFSDPGY